MSRKFTVKTKDNPFKKDSNSYKVFKVIVTNNISTLEGLVEKANELIKTGAIKTKSKPKVFATLVLLTFAKKEIIKFEKK